MSANRKPLIWLAAAIVAENGLLPGAGIPVHLAEDGSRADAAADHHHAGRATLTNYVRVFTDQPILLFLFNSVVVAACATAALRGGFGDGGLCAGGACGSRRRG